MAQARLHTQAELWDKCGYRVEPSEDHIPGWEDYVKATVSALAEWPATQVAKVQGVHAVYLYDGSGVDEYANLLDEMAVELRRIASKMRKLGTS